MCIYISDEALGVLGGVMIGLGIALIMLAIFRSLK